MGPRKRPWSMGIALLVALFLSSPRTASADEQRFERSDGAMAWSIAGLEVATATALILRMSVWRGPMGDTEEALLLTAPFFVGGASGVAGWGLCLPPRVALGLHGGLYTGLAAGLGAGLVRGALSEGGTLRFDALTGVVALVGTVPGFVIGALEVDPDDPILAWFGGPPGGLFGGVIVAAVVAVVAFLSGNDPGPGAGDQMIGWPIFAGLSTGLVVAIGSVVE